MALIVQGRRCVSMESALIRGWNQWFREDESILTTVIIYVSKGLKPPTRWGILMYIGGLTQVL